MLSKLGWQWVHAIYSATPTSAVGPTPPMAAILHTCEATCELPILSVFARISLASLSLFIKGTCKPRSLFSLSSLSFFALSEIASASDSNRRILYKLWVETIFIPISCFDFVPYLGVFNLGVCCWTLGLKFQAFPIIARWKLFWKKWINGFFLILGWRDFDLMMMGFCFYWIWMDGAGEFCWDSEDFKQLGFVEM